jgi:hypothetical protein
VIGSLDVAERLVRELVLASEGLKSEGGRRWQVAIQDDDMPGRDDLVDSGAELLVLSGHVRNVAVQLLGELTLLQPGSPGLAHVDAAIDAGRALVAAAAKRDGDEIGKTLARLRDAIGAIGGS